MSASRANATPRRAARSRPQREADRPSPRSLSLSAAIRHALAAVRRRPWRFTLSLATLLLCAYLPSLSPRLTTPQPSRGPSGYSLLSTRYSALSTSLTPRRAFAAAFLSGRLYAVGGWNGDATQLDTVEVLDSARGLWTPAPPLAIARSQHGLVEADGRLWTVGGWSAARGLVSEVEVLYPNSAAWSVVTHLPTPRREPGVAVLGRRIVVVGGFDGHNDSEIDGYSDVVEAYDLDTGRWQRLARLQAPRRGLTLVAMSEALYAVGGYTLDSGFLNTVEVYHADRDTWQTLDWPIAPRTWAAAAVVDNALFLIGGYSQHGFLGLVERVDPATGRVCQAGPLHNPRAWLAALPYAGGILTLGGEDATGIKNSVEWLAPDCS